MPPTEQPAYGRCFQLGDQAALMRLQGLKVLRIGDFITSSLVSSLSDVVLPQLHTFAFQLITQPCNGSDPSAEFTWELEIPPYASKLAAVFPNLNHLRVCHIKQFGSRCGLVS